MIYDILAAFDEASERCCEEHPEITDEATSLLRQYFEEELVQQDIWD